MEIESVSDDRDDAVEIVIWQQVIWITCHSEGYVTRITVQKLIVKSSN